MENRMKQHVMLGVIIAVNLVLSYIVKVPSPRGFVSLVEVGIFIAAWRYGAKAGAVVGGLTGLLLDLLAGYPQWMLPSLLIHGTEGYLYGRISKRWLGLVVGGVVMIVGYWIAGALLLVLMGTQTGAGAIWAALATTALDIPGNVLQVTFGFIAASIVWPVLSRVMAK